MTLRESEAEGICSAALKEMLNIVKDQIEERILTNSRFVAEQIKSDKVENVATGGINIGESGKVGNRPNLKIILMDGVSKLEKLENRRIPKLTRKGKIRTERTCASQP